MLLAITGGGCYITERVCCHQGGCAISYHRGGVLSPRGYTINLLLIAITEGVCYPRGGTLAITEGGCRHRGDVLSPRGCAIIEGVCYHRGGVLYHRGGVRSPRGCAKYHGGGVLSPRGCAILRVLHTVHTIRIE